VTKGSVKRLTFLVGIVALVVGLIALLDPVSVGAGDHNCGSAFLAKPMDDPAEAVQCDRELGQRRRFGSVLVVFGVAAFIWTGGPRILMTPDPD
jgi:hypothetical protein